MELDGEEVQNSATAWVERVLDEQVKQHDN